MRKLIEFFDKMYNWDSKEVECYRLYVQENRGLDEVMEYWEQRGFTPRYVFAQSEVRAAVQRHLLHSSCYFGNPLVSRGSTVILTSEL